MFLWVDGHFFQCECSCPGMACTMVFHQQMAMRCTMHKCFLVFVWGKIACWWNGFVNYYNFLPENVCKMLVVFIF